MAQDTLGRYILDRKLATGGMAEIWVAHQAGPAGFQKECVVKRILPHLLSDEKFVEMFLDEARLAAQLSHPNIAQIFDLGEVDGDYFIAMEFVEGQNLQQLLEQSQKLGMPVPPPVVARLISDACAALEYAHNFRDRDGNLLGLVHRDISPQNILVSKDGIVKLVDFGVAKAASSSHKTQTGAVKGKLSYMSPEQISGKPLDGRSDLFSLGIVLYELVTGRRPFGHDSEFLAITAILNENPTRPCEVLVDLPVEYEAVIMRALEKAPKDRFQSAGEMQAALEATLIAQGTQMPAREIGRYLNWLFSEQREAQFEVSSELPGGLTWPVHPSATTRPGDTAPQQVSPGLAATDPQMRLAQIGDPVDYREERSKPSMLLPILASLIMLMLISGVGFYLYKTFGPDSGWSVPSSILGGGLAQSEEPTATPEPGGTGTPSEDSLPSPDTPANIDPAAALDPTGDNPGKGNNADNPNSSPENAGTENAGTENTGAETAKDLPGDPSDPGSPGDHDDNDSGTAVAVNDPGVGPGGDDDANAANTNDDGGAEDDSGTVSGSDDAAAAEADLPANTADAPDTGSGGDTNGGNTNEMAQADHAARDGSRTEPTPTTRPDPPTSRPDPVRRSGTLTLTFQSGGQHEVWIDGNKVGSYPPTRRFTVNAGQHTLRVVGADGSRFEESIEIPSGGSHSVRIP